QLVWERGVRHRLTLLVAGAQQERQDIPTLIDVGVLAAKRDLLVEQRVSTLEPSPQPPSRAQRDEDTAQDRWEEERPAHVHDRKERSAQAPHALAVGDSEHR